MVRRTIAPIKVFTVTRDETDLIEDFIRYHGSLVGYDNIVIIDNCSTCPVVLGVYNKYRPLGVTISKESRYEGGGQGMAFTKHMREHKSKCRFLIGLDTDEFIYTSRDDLLSYIDRLPKNSTIFKVSRYLCSVPDTRSASYVNQKVSRPALDIETFVEEPATPCKCFFRSDAFVSTVNGCHNGKTSVGSTCDVNLQYVHFHNTGARRSVERARSIINGYGYTDVDGSIESQLLDMVGVTSPCGSHRVLEYAIFLSRVHCLTRMVEIGAWPASEKHLDVISKTFPFINGWGNLSIIGSMVNLPKNWPSRFDSMLFYDPPLNRNTVKTTTISDILRC